MDIHSAMKLVDRGFVVTRKSWNGKAIVYLDPERIPVKDSFGEVEIYNEHEDWDTHDWEVSMD